MCGIAGILSVDGRPVFEEELRAMCAAMVQRGPDDEGVYLSEHAGLAMRRLSVIDLTSGHQPVGNEDGTIWVVLNGEIYNYRELREDLESRGHVFTTATDTEVIVHLYEELGAGCVERLRGMFAFAVWDERRLRLMLARDRLGIKPLYYGIVKGRLLFASELKAVLQIPEVERTIDWAALDHLLAFATTSRTQSIVAGIQKLEAGHLMLIAPGGAPRVERYWTLRFEPEYGRSEDDVAEELRWRLAESVRLHLVSDVPVGAFLSGGVDSSSVVAAMVPLTGGRLKTFSIGFTQRDYDELPYARLVAERFGTEHHELVLDPDGALDILGELPWLLDEPFGDSSAFPTYLVSKLARRHVAVVLSGDGGDELFAGYRSYVVEARERRRSIPRPVRAALGLAARSLPDGARGRNFLRRYSLQGPERYLDANLLFRREDRRRLLTAEAGRLALGHRTEEERIEELAQWRGHWLSNLQACDLRHYLPLDILTKVDRMSMAHSLEARVPLLDHPFVEFAARIPPDMTLKDGRTKHIFVRAMRGVLPDEVLDRPKQGFAVPLGAWLRGRLDSVVQETVLSDECRRRGLLNHDYVAALVRLHRAGRPLDMQLWTLISLELWCRTFLDHGPARRQAVRASRIAQSHRPIVTSSSRQLPTSLNTRRLSDLRTSA